MSWNIFVFVFTCYSNYKYLFLYYSRFLISFKVNKTKQTNKQINTPKCTALPVACFKSLTLLTLNIDYKCRKHHQSRKQTFDTIYVELALHIVPVNKVFIMLLSKVEPHYASGLNGLHFGLHFPKFTAAYEHGRYAL